jgi:hypothetical protein
VENDEADLFGELSNYLEVETERGGGPVDQLA